MEMIFSSLTENGEDAVVREAAKFNDIEISCLYPGSIALYGPEDDLQEVARILRNYGDGGILDDSRRSISF